MTVTVIVRVNHQDVQVRVLQDEHHSQENTLDESERRIVQRADRLLRSTLEFIQLYPGARLTLIESNRRVTLSTRGRFYLRYEARDARHADVWAHEGPEEHLDLRRGLVIVPTLP